MNARPAEVTVPVAALDGACLPALDVQAQVLDVLRRLFLHGPGRSLADALDATAAFPEPEWPARVAAGLRQMRKAMATHAGQTPPWLDLEVEFTRLTLGPVQIPAVPYASFHLSPGGSLMTDETLAVRQRYLQAGLAVRDQGRMPDDHLGVELEFLHWLTARAAQADATGDAAVRDDALRQRAAFVTEHAARWLPAFAQALESASDEPLFREVATLLRWVVAIAPQVPRED